MVITGLEEFCEIEGSQLDSVVVGAWTRMGRKKLEETTGRHLHSSVVARTLKLEGFASLESKVKGVVVLVEDTGPKKAEFGKTLVCSRRLARPSASTLPAPTTSKPATSLGWNTARVLIGLVVFMSLLRGWRGITRHFCHRRGPRLGCRGLGNFAGNRDITSEKHARWTLQILASAFPDRPHICAPTAPTLIPRSKDERTRLRRLSSRKNDRSLHPAWPG
ncbi:hypothetical protein B0H16DRAFT_862784 [Mycena metata]|uniref:Uncharacterized protein n=1 Tax=Mycena metata TaxID=1033252 RepID=A0AAD7IW14_9AGAR|nr:hypothetical protein B0H16DRAFT_862784 [Mycena metata]